jgi:uncharacterized membrane protein YbhN (UPF0104 family)
MRHGRSRRTSGQVSAGPISSAISALLQLHTPISRMSWFAAVLGINAAIVLPTVPGNFGTFEAGAIMALILSGTPRETAMLFALTYHLTHIIPVAIVATTVYLVRSRRKLPPEVAG